MICNIRRFVCFAALAALLAAPSPGLAGPATSNKDQTAGPTPTQTVHEDRATSGGSNEPLSDKLDRSGGIIHPPGDVDPGMTQAPPHAGSKSTPVIPPPGAKSGVNPK
jgi:hypothetical protein